MRKRFPAPKGLGSRSYADRYSESRSNRKSKNDGNTKSKVKFLGSDKPLAFKFRNTPLNTKSKGVGIYYLLFSLPPLAVIGSVFFYFLF